MKMWLLSAAVVLGGLMVVWVEETAPKHEQPRPAFSGGAGIGGR